MNPDNLNDPPESPGKRRRGNETEAHVDDDELVGREVTGVLERGLNPGEYMLTVKVAGSNIRLRGSMSKEASDVLEHDSALDLEMHKSNDASSSVPTECGPAHEQQLQDQQEKSLVDNQQSGGLEDQQYEWLSNIMKSPVGATLPMEANQAPIETRQAPIVIQQVVPQSSEPVQTVPEVLTIIKRDGVTQVVADVPPFGSEPSSIGKGIAEETSSEQTNYWKSYIGDPGSGELETEKALPESSKSVQTGDPMECVLTEDVDATQVRNRPQSDAKEKHGSPIKEDLPASSPQPLTEKDFPLTARDFKDSLFEWPWDNNNLGVLSSETNTLKPSPKIEDEKAAGSVTRMEVAPVQPVPDVAAAHIGITSDFQICMESSDSSEAESENASSADMEHKDEPGE